VTLRLQKLIVMLKWILSFVGPCWSKCYE